jgi:hypothetical protein
MVQQEVTNFSVKFSQKIRDNPNKLNFLQQTEVIQYMYKLTQNDMAYFMHLAVWPPKSSLTPNKVWQMVNTQKF